MQVENKKCLIFDPCKATNEVLPSLSSAISSLTDALSIISGIAIPDDFEYTAELSGIPSKINTITTNVNGQKEYIIDCIIQMIALENENEGLVNQLGNTDIDWNSIRTMLQNGGQFVDIGKKKILIIPKTREGFIACLAAISEKYAAEGWSYGTFGLSNLIYDKELGFAGAINNPDKTTVCATLVASALYASGWVDNSDFTFKTAAGERFNPNWQNHVMNVCNKNIGCDPVERKDDLQPGDIMFYWGVNSRTGKYEMVHTDVYMGKNDDGQYIFYDAGSNDGIKEGAPVPHGISGKWIAYRLPADSLNFDDVADENTQVGVTLGINTPSNNETLDIQMLDNKTENLGKNSNDEIPAISINNLEIGEDNKNKDINKNSSESGKKESLPSLEEKKDSI